jgi:two-component system response regulator MprA
MPNSLQVLIVEDDADVREALAYLLEEEGVRVIEAANGREALDRIEGGLEPDLILLDLMMPVMDGERFLRIRMSDSRLSAIPVVVVSALQRMSVDPAEFNVDEVISKPVDPGRILETVRRYGAAS